MKLKSSRRGFTFLSLWFILSLWNLSFAQQATITGKVVEESTQEPMQFVNVALYHSRDTSLAHNTVTDKNGVYEFTLVANGSYYLKISFIGFEPIVTPPFRLDATNTHADMGTTAIKISSTILNEVEVKDDKPLYENSIDRKVYHVDQDMMSKSGSASEVLANVPSVSVDVDGTVSLRNSTNVTILINGKPSPQMRLGSDEALQQIPANTIERIEIITNPSAKYKPDGTAGIINIVLKKETTRGLNGSLTANAGNDNRYNSTINMNYNFGKVNLYGSYGIRHNYRYRTSIDERIIKDSLGRIINYFHQESVTNSHPLSHTAQLGFDYNINNKNLIGASGTYYYRDLSLPENMITTITDTFQQVTLDYTRALSNTEFEWERAFTAHFNHKFKKEDNELNIEFETTESVEEEDNHFTNTYRTPEAPLSFDNTLLQTGANETFLNAEYLLPIGEDAGIELGYEGEFIRERFSLYASYFDSTLDSWVDDVSKSNDFHFDQDIHAFYATYEQSLGEFQFLVGLRGEDAFRSSKLITRDSAVSFHDLSLYPSLHVAYEFNDEKQLQLSYSKRINRPEDDQVNPFPDYEDPRDIKVGNPYLRPEQVHSLEFGYQVVNDRFTFVPGVFYRYKYNGFTEISTYINDSTLLTTSENLTSQQSGGIELVLAGKVKKMVTFNFSADGYFDQIDASDLDESENKSAFSWSAKLSATGNLTKSTMMQLNASYTSAMLTPHGKYLPVFVLNTGVRQDILKKKASILLTVSDVFNTLRWQYQINTTELYQQVTNKRKSRVIYLGFTYRFGKSDKNEVEDLKFDEKL